MIPLIIRSANKKRTTSFIASYSKKHRIPSSQIYHIEPPKSEISIDQIREIKRNSHYSYDGIRLFVIWRFDSASVEAQNAFLKTLEEHCTGNQYILVCESVESVVPTILSRSKIASLDESSSEEENPKLSAELHSLLTQTEKKQNYEFLGDLMVMNATKEKTLSLFNEIIKYYRKRMKDEVTEQTTAILKKTLVLRRLLEVNNLNPQFTIDTLLIFIHKAYRMKDRA